MTSTQFDIPEMQTVYNEKQNYQILTLDPNNNQCLIYFSSNGLYFPNDAKVFKEVVIEQDRFEWKKNILESAGKAIFLRDVTKQWYWNGINSTINSIEKLTDFLRHQTQEFEVTCIGSSAGGYASTLFGVLLQAHRIFAFSPQFSLKFIISEGHTTKNPSIAKLGILPENMKYLELQNLLHENQTPIFHFFPGLSERDIEQANLIKGTTSVHSFKFESAVHGTTCYPINFLDLFSMSNENLIELQSHFGTELIHPLEFSKKVSGTLTSYSYLLKNGFSKITKHLR